MPGSPPQKYRRALAGAPTSYSRAIANETAARRRVRLARYLFVSAYVNLTEHAPGRGVAGPAVRHRRQKRSSAADEFCSARVSIRRGEQSRAAVADATPDERRTLGALRFTRSA